MEIQRVTNIGTIGAQSRVLLVPMGERDYLLRLNQRTDGALFLEIWKPFGADEWSDVPGFAYSVSRV